MGWRWMAVVACVATSAAASAAVLCKTRAAMARVHAATSRRAACSTSGLRGAFALYLLAALVWPCRAVAMPFAYVANSASNTVSVLDTATNTVTATVQVGTNPYAGPYAVAVSHDGTRAYVTTDQGLPLIQRAQA